MTWPPGTHIEPRFPGTREHVHASEAIERADWREAYRSVDPATAEAFGIRFERLGHVDLLIMTHVDLLMFNRMSGLGVDEPASEELLDQAIGRYRKAGVPRFFVGVSVAARPIQLTDWITGRGLSLHNSWVKLTRPVDPIPNAFTTARIKEIGREHADDFGRTIQTVFGMPERMADWAAALVGQPGRRHFMAFVHDKPVGTAALYYEGDWAEFGYAAVLPDSRGKGIQAALIAARIRAAREAGCKWISMETAEETLEKPSYSFRNAKRMGFETMYLRPNYLGTTTSST
ncbi:MAG TPA: GNAT family N-acetyltransferase [Candidatus Dormibacteraeota bacterium]|nr:GNAT family N-acetyltransferase [Candidatus Dormibacteraeota bacterium]